jgi:hypothetical protein
MKDLMRRRIAMFNAALTIEDRVIHRLKPRGRALFTALRDEMLNLRKEQSGAVEIFHNGTRQRAAVAKELRERLLEVAQMARTLDQVEFPEAGKLKRVTTSRGYYPLRFDAMNFIKVLPALAQEYIDREFPEDFIAELQRLLDRFEEMTGMQSSGRSQRIASTAGLYAVSRRGMRIVMELDAVLGMLLRRTDPGLYAAWKAASHVERQPVRKQKPDSTAADAGGESPNQPAIAGAGRAEKSKVETAPGSILLAASSCESLETAATPPITKKDPPPPPADSSP